MRIVIRTQCVTRYIYLYIFICVIFLCLYSPRVGVPSVIPQGACAQRPTGSLFDVIFLTPRPPILWRFLYGVYMIRIILFLLPVFIPAVCAGQTIAEKMAYVSQLRTEISELDDQLSECKQHTNKWTIATIAGGVGTGIGIGIQANQLNKLKKTDANEQNAKSSGSAE